MANEFMGWQRRLHVVAESTWGTFPGSPVYLYLPYESFDVQISEETRQSDLYTGIRQRRHNQIFRRRIDGTLACPLFGHQINDDDNSGTGTVSYAELLIRWAFDNPASSSLLSKSIELYDVHEVKRFTGLRVNQATISGNANQNNVTISLSLMGKDEATVSAGSAQALDATLIPEQTEFAFSDVVLTIGGSAVAIESFTLTISNNLSENFLNSSTRSLLDAGARVVDLQFQKKKEGNTHDALRRNVGSQETTGSLVLKGRHNGTGATGTYSVCTAAFDRLSFVSAPQTGGGKNEHAMQQINYAVLKPNTTDNEVDWTFANGS